MYDFAVIGAGVVGCAIARELAARDVSVVVVEAGPDIGGVGAGEAGTAVIHTGLDVTPGTLEADLVGVGGNLLDDYAERVGVPLQRTGAVQVAWNLAELDALAESEALARLNGRDSVHRITADELQRTVPALGPGVLGGLALPDAAIVSPWAAAFALATDAVNRGAKLLFGHRVTGVDVTAGHTLLRTTRGAVPCRWAVNAAGVRADQIDRMYGLNRLRLALRREESVEFEMPLDQPLDQIVVPVPAHAGHGLRIHPTIHGTITATAAMELLADRGDLATTETGQALLADRTAALIPGLVREEVVASHSVVRVTSDHADYVIEARPDQRYAVAAAIGTTGVAAAMAVGQYLVERLEAVDPTLPPPRQVQPPAPTLPVTSDRGSRPYADSSRVALDPEYGKVVCFCEKVTAGEIRDALHCVVPPTDLHGLRRRTRAMGGRCQGTTCGPEIARRFAAGTDGAGSDQAGTDR